MSSERKREIRRRRKQKKESRKQRVKKIMKSKTAEKPPGEV